MNLSTKILAWLLRKRQDDLDEKCLLKSIFHLSKSSENQDMYWLTKIMTSLLHTKKIDAEKRTKSREWVWLSFFSDHNSILRNLLQTLDGFLKVCRLAFGCRSSMDFVEFLRTLHSANHLKGAGIRIKNIHMINQRSSNVIRLMMGMFNDKELDVPINMLKFFLQRSSAVDALELVQRLVVSTNSGYFKTRIVELGLAKSILNFLEFITQTEVWIKFERNVS